MIATAVLKDTGLVSFHDKQLVTDKNKIRRERSRVRKELVDKQILNNQKDKVVGLFFDGKIDQTLSMVKSGTKSARKIVTEEHIVLLKQPGSKYWGHVTPNSSSAEDIASSIFEFIGEKIRDIFIVGCDGTAVNTGFKNGIVARIEREIEHPVQWAVCMLHGNELPLRAIMKKLDGGTKGPCAHGGEIGKQLQNCETLPIVEFHAINGEIITADMTQLSTDQKYLLEIYQSVSAGSVDPNLAVRDPGNICMSRWLTTANRLLRLYVSTNDPSDNLVKIVTFIMLHYVPNWFDIKRNGSVTSGAQLLFKSIDRLKKLPESVRKISEPVIQRNCYFGHHENILLSMIFDNKQAIRLLGWQRIKKARTSNSVRSSIRAFRLPEINFNAESYIDMVKWQDIVYTEPPLTTVFSDHQINQFCSTAALPDDKWTEVPCDTQAVERHIKLVSEASATVCGKERRDGFILSSLASREKQPQFENKSDFVL